jgi:hypothetical protein
MSLKRTDLQRLADILPGAFYAVTGIAFLSLLLGSPGAAMLFLIVGALVHVARVGVEYTLGANLRRR